MVYDSDDMTTTINTLSDLEDSYIVTETLRSEYDQSIGYLEIEKLSWMRLHWHNNVIKLQSQTNYNYLVLRNKCLNGLGWGNRSP
jgi:hypothetical protein